MKEQRVKRQRKTNTPPGFANANSIYYSHMYNKTDRKVKPTIVKNYRTFGVSITELQVRFKRSFRIETRTQGQKNSFSVI